MKFRRTDGSHIGMTLLLLAAGILAFSCASESTATDAGVDGGQGGKDGGGTDGGGKDGGGQYDGSLVCGDYSQLYSATGTDQSAILVDGTSLDVNNPIVTSDSNTSSQDNSSFYGLNAGVLVKNGGRLNMICGTVTTTGSGANGVFSTGTGSDVFLYNVKIKCSGEGGHGVDATQAGVMTIENVDIETSGSHGAALATDRGGGTITATGGNMVTSGTDSPGIYSTGTITVTGATINAKGSEAAVIEGANFIYLTDTSLTAAKGSRDWGNMIYQSMSGDAEGNKGTFTMTGGSFTWPSTTGPAFFVTNTTAVITLKGITINNSSPTFIKAAAGQWGTSGSNGGTVNLTADAQTMTGSMVGDSISSFTIVMKNSSSLTGAIDNAKTAKAVDLTMDASSTWNVSADSVVTTLTDADTAFANIVSNGHNVCYTSKVNGSGSGTYSLPGGGQLKPCN